MPLSPCLWWHLPLFMRGYWIVVQKTSLVLDFGFVCYVCQVLWDAWKFTCDDWLHRYHCGASPLTFSQTVSLLAHLASLTSHHSSTFCCSLYSLLLCRTFAKTPSFSSSNCWITGNPCVIVLSALWLDSCCGDSSCFKLNRLKTARPGPVWPGLRIRPALSGLDC